VSVPSKLRIFFQIRKFFAKKMQDACIFVDFFVILRRKTIKTMRIGVFDSGYGGLTVLEKIRQRLPEYDYIYLGDNARAPYGTRSYELIYNYTWQAVRYLFQQGCALVILACNTASAKALRTIQQNDLPALREDGQVINVLGVIRPTAEVVSRMTTTGHIGVLATPGTVQSGSYPIEFLHQNPSLSVTQQACPLWVPLIEAGEHTGDGADYFVRQYIDALLAQDDQIDTIVLGCTHYPLLMPKIQEALHGRNIRVVAQGDLVAASLDDYLHRHGEINGILTRGGTCRFFTTESATRFRESANIFLRRTISVQHIDLP